MYLNAPDLYRTVFRIKDNFLVFPYFTFGKRTCNNSPEAFHGKYAVYGKPEMRALLPGRKLPVHFIQCLLQNIQPLVFVYGYGNHGSIFQKCILYKLPDIFFHKSHKLRLRQIGFGDNDHAVADSKNRKDIQMFHRLGHHALICRHYKHYKIHATCSRQHVFYKFFMSGHIHDPYSAAIRKIHPGKAKLNGNASFFFFFQTVCVYSCQCLDQAGLSMIHMPRRADDSISHNLNLWSVFFFKNFPSF